MDTNKKIAIGSDHAGYEIKEDLKKCLIDNGWEVIDFGTNSENSVDYPDIGKKIAEVVSKGKITKGILICGTGLGMSYTANRFQNVRAALCWDKEVAMLSREHNDANILVLPGRVKIADKHLEILKVWLDTPFSNDERHKRRIMKIDQGDNQKNESECCGYNI